MALTGRRVLVAGGTGFVGRHVVAALREEGHEVTVLARHASRARLPTGVAGVTGDLKDPASYRDAVPGHDAVVNCVGLIRNRRLAGQTFERVVAAGTQGLVEAAKAGGVRRVVHVSANGARPKGTAYQRTKWLAEDAVRGSGLAWTILRPSLVFGPDDDFTNKMRRLMRLGALPYFGRGEYTFAPVHADDVGRAVAKCLTTPAAVGRVFHLCGPESFAYRSLLREIKAASGSRAILFPLPRAAIRSATLLLGWMPWFPATREQLTMLFEGNTCPEHDWVQILKVAPTPFRESLRAYLAPLAGSKTAKADPSETDS